MMILAVLVVLTATLLFVGTLLLITGSLSASGQPGELSRGTLAFHFVLEVVFIGLGIWLFRFAHKLRKALKTGPPE